MKYIQPLIFLFLLYSYNVQAQKLQFGKASFYHNKFNGRKTANGEIFSNKKMTCANNKIKLGTYIKVTNLKNNKSIIVKVNDRLAPNNHRIVDLTYAAAKKLDFIDRGLTNVSVEILSKHTRKEKNTDEEEKVVDDK